MKESKTDTVVMDVRTRTAARPRAGIAAEAAVPLGRAFARWALEAVGRPPVSIVLPNGEEVCTCQARPVARMRVRDTVTLAKLLLSPSLCFGDGYRDGRIDVEGDLVEFLEAVYRGIRDAGPAAGARRWMESLAFGRQGSNTLARSRENIHRHYDIGNDFYRLWLDPELVYTCAYFPSPSASLEEAQTAKMRHVCQKLRLQPGEVVVEAGCGWGALALFMARNYGVHVRAYNISREQIAYARQRAAAEGLEGRVEFIEDDYRNIGGRCDAFVSVGMLEHVGRDHYRELGGVIDRCLDGNGRGLLHAIGRNQPGELDLWIRRRIFPGAYPPTLREMMDVLEPWGFSVLDVENLRLHYARTLEAWLERYESAADRVARMFDERFLRAWRLYLAGSIAGFTTGSLQLFQLVFARPSVNEIPWTRAHLYVEERGGGVM